MADIKTPYMFSYGSNLCLQQMLSRCPKAEPLGIVRLPNWKLVFRGVADIIYEPGALCYGGGWKITPQCEAALDVYEGIAGGMYKKVYIPIRQMKDGSEDMMVYVMNSTGIMPPSEHYLNVIAQGYRDFHMPRRAWRMLRKTVRESWDDKAPSNVERFRYRRNGYPKLADVDYQGDNNHD